MFNKSESQSYYHNRHPVLLNMSESSIMDVGDELRKNFKTMQFLYAGVTAKIKENRNQDTAKTAFIVNSLKHPEEVAFI